MTALAQNHRLNLIFVYGLFIVAICSVLVYLALTVATIFATSRRSAAVHSSAKLTSEIGELEQSYLILQGRVNPTQAVSLGLVAPKQVTSVSVGDRGLSLRN